MEFRLSYVTNHDPGLYVVLESPKSEDSPAFRMRFRLYKRFNNRIGQELVKELGARIVAGSYQRVPYGVSGCTFFSIGNCEMDITIHNEVLEPEDLCKLLDRIEKHFEFLDIYN